MRSGFSSTEVRWSTPTRARRRFIAYYRVSTPRQGQSGLGLEAQQAAVRDYINAHRGTLLAEFTEVESGRKSDRHRLQLRAALAQCREQRAVLVIAKLDRLARNVAFLSALIEGGLEFDALDIPGATRLTIHVLAAVAEDEARRTSERTKAALAAAKRRGVRFGNPHMPNAHEAGRASGALRRQVTQAYYNDNSIADLVLLWRERGWSYRSIAAELTARKKKTQDGRTTWNPMLTRRVWMNASAQVA